MLPAGRHSSFAIRHFPSVNLANAITVGLKEIWAHKLRSVLTMLGIILGVASLIGMSAITKGMENGMKESLIALGGLDKVMTDEQPVPTEQEHRANEAPGRTIQDVYALKQSAPLLRLISPEMRTRNLLMTYGPNSVTPSQIVGVWTGNKPSTGYTVRIVEIRDEVRVIRWLLEDEDGEEEEEKEDPGPPG